MNKKLVVFTSFALVALVVVALSFWGLVFSSHRVTVSLPDGVEAISINGASHENSDRFAIEPGDYTYSLTGENIDRSRREITISSDQDQLSITYAPYSRAYLSKLLTPETPTIRQLVNSQLLSRVDGYKLQHLSLIDRGQYAAVLLTPVDIDIDNPSSVYRLILEKSSGKWQVVAGPVLLLTTTNTDQVPKHILQLVNDLSP